MQLTWLGEHRELIEKLIKFGNAYAGVYQKEQNFGTTESFSSAQIQTMEYILENEEKNQSMAEIASRLGISPSSFSKHVNKMIGKGLLEKYHTSDNRKNVIIRVSDKGRRVYGAYCDYVSKSVLNELYEILEGIPGEYEKMFSKALDLWANDLNRQPVNKKTVTLIRIEK